MEKNKFDGDKKKLPYLLRNNKRKGTHNNYSQYAPVYKLAYMLTHSNNVLVFGEDANHINRLVEDIITKLRGVLENSNKKLNIRNLYDNESEENIICVNKLMDIKDSFFIHDKYTCGSIATITAKDEFNAAVDLALNLRKPLEYVLSNFDYLVKVGEADGIILIIESENLGRTISRSSICNYSR